MKTYTESEVRELLRREQQNVLNIISEQFLKSENYKQATFHDKVLFRALGETIPNFPLPLPILPEKEETNLNK